MKILPVLPLLLALSGLPVLSPAADPPERRQSRPVASLPAPAAAGALRILLVDDDLSDNNNIPGDKRLSPSDQVFRKLAADAAGGDANAWAVEIVKTNASGPDIERLRRYSLILWYTGASYGGNPDNTAVLSIDDEKTVRRYLQDVGGVVVLFSPGYASKVLGAGGTWDEAKWPFLSEVLGIRGGVGLAQRFTAGTVKAADGAQFSVGTSAVVETQFSTVNPDGAAVLFTTELAAVKKGGPGTPVATVHAYGRGRIIYVGFTFENLAQADLTPAFQSLLAASGLQKPDMRVSRPTGAVKKIVTPVDAGPATVQVTGTPTTAVVSWTLRSAQVLNASPIKPEQTARKNPSAASPQAPVTIERLVPNAAAVKLNLVSPDATQASDPGPLTPGTPLTYRVTVTDASGTTGFKEAAYTPPLPKDPDSLSASVQGDGSIVLSWPEVPGVAVYQIMGSDNYQPVIVRNATEWRSPRLSAVPRRWTVNSVYEPGGSLTQAATWPFAKTEGISNAGLPTPTKMFLTLPNGAGSYAESLAHFRTRCIDALAPDSLCTAAGFIRPTTNWEDSFRSGDWAGQSFVPPQWPIAAFDDILDLGVARRVNCSPRSFGTTVCWATSYHFNGTAEIPPGAGTDKPKSLSLIIMADDSAFFGSWEWTGSVLPGQSSVTARTIDFGLDVEHYFAEQGSLRAGAALDSQGRKGVPHACLSCHGGRYDANSGKVIGASLLPLVPARYARTPLVSAGNDSGQEAIRRINQIILQSNPAPAIVDQINAMYNGAPNTAGAVANNMAVPSGWNQQQGLYKQVVGPYCASCHFAQRGALNFRSWGNMLQSKDAVQRAICTDFTMPHSEILFRKFWTEGNSGSLPALLSTSLGFPKCR